ncbi:MAG: ABC transporter substrate-binding protein, partial [Gammaproteobacteria bacterium]|nr:ABC transporter substrate-binding protein [Gammaproteobacteria bacterium]
MEFRIFAFTVLMVLLTFQVQASPSYAYPPQGMGVQQQDAGPGTIVREGMTKLLKFMRHQERPNPQAIGGFVENEIAPYFDFAYMAQWSAGPAYRNMNDAQRSVLEQKVKEMLLSTLVKRLTSYDNQDVRFFRPRRAGKNEVKVRVGILQAGGYPANIDFRFYLSDSGWKVFDVSANGTSALSYYRQ